MTIKSQNAILVSLRQTIDSNNEAMAVMNEKIDSLTQKFFGTSSEKSKSVEGQLSLFDEAEPEAGPTWEPEAEETVVREHTRKAKGTHAERFKGVPVKEEVIQLSEGQKQCTDCGTQMEVIGREFVRQEFRFTPAKGEVVNIYRGTAKYPVCSEAPVMEKVVSFVKAPVPEARIPYSYASASAVAWTMYQKYANSLPLYRQEQDWKQIGIPLNRATLANWILYCAGNYFSPLYDYFHRELIKRQFLMADETRVQVLREPGGMRKRIRSCGCSEAGKTDLRPSSFINTHRLGRDSMRRIFGKASGAIWKQTVTRATTLCRRERGAAAGHICADTL